MSTKKPKPRQAKIYDDPPVPLDEASNPNRFWDADPGDSFLPTVPGFISDFVYFQRGVAVPTIFGIWTALFAISSVIKREAWIDWFPKSLYCNIYVLLVAPPAAAKKSTAIDMAVDLIDNLKEGLAADNSKKTKNFVVIRDKATPEKLLDTMAKASARRVKMDNGKVVSLGCPTVITASELATFLGKQKYNEGLIGVLLALYDTREVMEVATLSRDTQTLSKLYTTFLGGTTPDGLRDSIPEAALGDGFLSRTIVVYQSRRTRRFSMARKVEGGPTFDDLIGRLGWIAEETSGEHTLSEEAYEYYDRWHRRFTERQDMGDEWSKIASRMDVIVLKVSLLMKAQRYGEGSVIHKVDVENAVRLVEATFASTPDIVGQLVGDEMQKKIKRVEAYVKEQGEAGIGRPALMRNMHIVSREVTMILDYLVSTRAIEIRRDGGILQRSEKAMDETYHYIGQEVNGVENE